MTGDQIRELLGPHVDQKGAVFLRFRGSTSYYKATHPENRLTGLDARADGCLIITTGKGWDAVDPAEVIAVGWLDHEDDGPSAGQFL